MKPAAVLIAAISVIGFAAPVPAAPLPDDPVCATPDGSPCAPPPPGCVQVDNSLPCSSSLPDINAAIRKELQGILGGVSLGH